MKSKLNLPYKNKSTVFGNYAHTANPNFVNYFLIIHRKKGHSQNFFNFNHLKLKKEIKKGN